MTKLKPIVSKDQLFLFALFLGGFVLDCLLLQGYTAAQSGFVLSLIFLVFLSFYQQGALTLLFLFFIGFFYDALLGTVMGFTSLMWLSLHLLVVRNSSHFLHKSMLDAWLGYCFVAWVWSMSHWLIHAAMIEGGWGLYKPFVNTLVLSLLFPLIYGRFQRGRA